MYYITLSFCLVRLRLTYFNNKLIQLFISVLFSRFLFLRFYHQISLYFIYFLLHFILIFPYNQIMVSSSFLLVSCYLISWCILWSISFPLLSHFSLATSFSCAISLQSSSNHLFLFIMVFLPITLSVASSNISFYVVPFFFHIFIILLLDLLFLTFSSYNAFVFVIV